MFEEKSIFELTCSSHKYLVKLVFPMYSSIIWLRVSETTPDVLRVV